MNTKNKLLLLLTLLLSFPFLTQNILGQQIEYKWANNIEVFDINENKIENPWIGGLNALQYNSIDLNNDDTLDLLLFDRTSYKVTPFLAKNKKYTFAPEYINSFPPIEAWVVLADYNCDGKKDIFTHNNFGVTVYQNISEGNNLKFSLVGIPETKGFSGSQIPLKVDITDVPAITDVDNDGDLDLLTFLTPNIGGTVEFNKNMSMELFGTCDSLIFEKATARWGGFEEAGTCKTYSFDSQGRLEHAGSSILAIDFDADLDKDLLIGEISCTNLVQMTNEGTLEEAVFQSAAFSYPTQNPINLQIFPAAFYEDINFDGKRDLLVSPNIDFNEGFLTDFRNSSILYLNNNEDNSPDFQFTQNDFLQEEMLDFGEGALPTLADTDNDGDPDLYVGSTGYLQADGSFKAQVAYFENVGSLNLPQFILKDDDFLNLSQLNRIEIRPQWVDINKDGNLDFYFSSRENRGVTELNYILNNNNNFNLNTIEKIPLEGIRPLEKPVLFDFDSDGDLDVLLGKLNGALELHENDGNNIFVKTNNALGGITNNFFAQQLCPTLADINGDNKIDLITGSRRGTLNAYLAVQEQDVENWEALPIEYINTLTQDSEKIFLGKGVCPTAFGKSLVVGTIGGGLHYFLQQTSVVSNTQESNDLIQGINIYPNPASNFIKIESSDNLRLQIFGTDGRKIRQQVNIQKNTPLEISLNNYVNGLYFFKFEKNGLTSTQKVVVNH